MAVDEQPNPTLPGHAAEPATEDEFAPVLPGRGASDYERYLRTDDLLELQKPPEERVHHDELLFQTVHQSSELWLKLASHEVEVAAEHLARDEIPPALRLLRRSALCLAYITNQLEMLEQMSPWEYTRFLRPALGHGSGFDSPGFREARRVSPLLAQEFHRIRRAAGLSVRDVYVEGRDHENLYQLAEALTDWDERLNVWRFRHYKVVARIIGDSMVGTQGTPVEVLGGLIKNKLYPELWDARNELTSLAKESG